MNTTKEMVNKELHDIETNDTPESQLNENVIKLQDITIDRDTLARLTEDDHSDD